MFKTFKLKEISLSIGSGITPSRSNKNYWLDGTIPWLKTEQLGEHKIYGTTEKITKLALKETSIKIFPVDTLSIAMYGEGKTRGNVSILKTEMATNQACCNVIINKQKADYEYVYYYLKTKYIQLRQLSSGVRKNLNSNDIKEFEVKLPNLESQQKIAAVLSALDAKIELNNKINSELEAMAKTLYNYWFVQFDFPNSDGKSYKTSGGKMVWNEQLKRNIPADWEVVKINDIISVKDGTHDSPKSQNTGFPLITSKHLLNSGIDFKNANLISQSDFISINKRSKVETGDILFSMIGTIGEIYKVEEKNINFAIKNIALYKTSHKIEFKNYIYMYLKSCDMQRYMSNVLSGSIQKFIGLGDLRSMPLMIPISIIKQFEEKTESIFQQINNKKLENQTLAQLRDWLLPMLMNGQVTVI
ncbi:MAG: restriction endonuclease subunit S [Methylococcaceae bacterium]